MTKYHELQISANKTKKRVGRGIAAGQGKTAGRGTKGQGSRTGKKLKATFMGGQLSLVQAIPKARGFKSFRAPTQNVQLEDLNTFKTGVVDNFKLFEAGLIKDPYYKVKVISRGELKTKITLKTQAASQSVQDAITKAGGSFEKIAVPLRKSTKSPSEKTTKKATPKK